MHKCIWSTSPKVFAWRLNTAIFAHKCVQKTQISGAKNPNIGFFAREAVSNLQFETASYICIVKLHKKILRVSTKQLKNST